MTMYVAENYEVGRLLACSGALELAASCVLGVGMLALMQPWATALARRGPKLRDLGGMHLDLLMLAFVQIAAALLVRSFELSLSLPAAVVLMTGCWLNPVPYLVRGFGINAFALGGSRAQRFWALLGLASVVALLVGWGALAFALVRSR